MLLRPDIYLFCFDLLCFVCKNVSRLIQCIGRFSVSFSFYVHASSSTDSAPAVAVSVNIITTITARCRTTWRRWWWCSIPSSRCSSTLRWCISGGRALRSYWHFGHVWDKWWPWWHCSCYWGYCVRYYLCAALLLSVSIQHGYSSV